MAKLNRHRRWRGPALGGRLQRGVRFCFTAHDGEAATPTLTEWARPELVHLVPGRLRCRWSTRRGRCAQSERRGCGERGVVGCGAWTTAPKQRQKWSTMVNL